MKTPHQMTGPSYATLARKLIQLDEPKLLKAQEHLVHWIQEQRPCRTATLDHDATLIPSDQHSASSTYKDFPGFHPGKMIEDGDKWKKKMD